MHMALNNSQVHVLGPVQLPPLRHGSVQLTINKSHYFLIVRNTNKYNLYVRRKF